jgi:hypothetical protein
VRSALSKGAPEYVAGKSPEFLPAPYVRFVGRQQMAAEQVANIALDRPTNASSMAEPAQPGEDVALQRVALGLQDFKGRADKYPECACCVRHLVCPRKLTRRYMTQMGP